MTDDMVRIELTDEMTNNIEFERKRHAVISNKLEYLRVGNDEFLDLTFLDKPNCGKNTVSKLYTTKMLLS